MKKQNILIFINCSILLLIHLVSCSPQIKQTAAISENEKQPNILFIMTDDHTRQAMSAYDSKLIKTPNLDRIANDGILFKNSFVTNSICGPSRAVMLTGKYSHINGFEDNHSTFNTSQMIFPKLLQQAGYQTSIVGKWHLGNPPKGFDYWNILPGQGVYYNPVFIEMGDTVTYEGYVTDVTTDLAIQTLDKRDKNKPFCLLIHQKAPHRNWMPDTSELDLFTEDLPIPTNFFDDYENRSASVKKQDMRVADMYLSLDMKLQPEYFGKETGTGGFKGHDAAKGWQQVYQRMNESQKTAWDAHYDKVNKAYKKANLKGKDLEIWKYQRYIKDYLRCVVSVDNNVGRVLDYLEENGLEKNTLVIYTSDQGFYLGEHGWYDKRFMYEESFSTPLAIKYPAKIPAQLTTDALAMNLDFAPTILDFAGVNIPSEMQGLSLRPLCTRGKPEDWRTSIYYHYYQSTGWHHVPKHYGVRTDRYKLIYFYEIGDWELYDLEKDPNEMQNIYNQPAYKEVQQNLDAELKKLQAQYQVPS